MGKQVLPGVCKSSWKDLGSQSPGKSSPFPVPHPTRIKHRPGQFSPSVDKKSKANPFFHLWVPALYRGWESPEARSSGAEIPKTVPGLSLPVGVQRRPAGGSPSTLPALRFGAPALHHSCSYLERCVRAQGAGSRGAGGEPGAALSFLAPLRRRSRRREEPVRVCAGESLFCGVGGGGQGCGEGVAGRPACPAPRLPALFALRSLGRPGAA